MQLNRRKTAKNVAIGVVLIIRPEVLGLGFIESLVLMPFRGSIRFSELQKFRK